MAGTRADMYYEDHLRRLLDQRTARADLHGRFPSASDFSDSPSVYSHAHFSPRSIDKVELEASTSSLNYHALMSSEARHDRQRLNMPEASSLDLDDDPQPSYPSPIFPGDDGFISEEMPDDTSSEAHRVTYGPKMTVHSRAPWETGEDDLLAAKDEQDSSMKKAVLIFNRKDNSKKTRGRDARPPVAESRPSADSARSQSRGKQSFETTSSTISAGGALLYVISHTHP